MRKDTPPNDRERLLGHSLDAYGDTVFRLAVAQTRSRQDSEDAVQDVFLKLFSSETRFESEEHLKAWLIRTTVNRCHDIVRRRARRKTVPIDELPFEPKEQSADLRDDLLAAWDAISRLPEDQRVVMHLICIEGYSSKEVAAIMGVSDNAVRLRLSRARKTLRGADAAANDANGRKVGTHYALHAFPAYGQEEQR